MVELPDDISMLLVRGVGAYLRATPQTELPPKLRRFRSFRPQGLLPHRAELLAVLDDEGLRARITEWLEKDKPSLPKAEADALRIAAAQQDGWQGELKSRAKTTRPASKPTPAVADRVAVEQEKTRKARDEARRAKEEARAAVQEQRARVSALTDEMRELSRRLTESERMAAAAAKEAAREHDRLERDARKARTMLEKLEAERDRAKEDVKQARREATALRREIAALKSELTAATKKTEARPKKASSPRTRKPLPVPKGRLEDAPETLESWLGNGRVHLLIDGYNVAKAEGGFGKLPLEKQRDRLVQEANKLAHRVEGRTIVVFDGSKVPAGIARRSRGKAEVEFSRDGEIADDHIIVRLEELPPEPAILVTNDKELQQRGRKLGATIATSNQLLALVR